MRFQNEQYVLFICRKAAKRNPKRLILNIPWLTEIKYLYNTHALKKLKLRLFNFIFKQRQCRKLHLSCEKGILLIGLFVRIISISFVRMHSWSYQSVLLCVFFAPLTYYTYISWKSIRQCMIDISCMDLYI